MSSNKTKILAVPTNVITGFLGVGKTSAISQLLKHKPANERWAILVNEFGEVGIDGGLFAGLSPNDAGIFIEQVPGGCMCCASGLPMQIALNQLLIKAEPHRLLIEPTGLGHPKEVLQLLSNPHYQKVLDLQKTITLVDARQLKDQRYTEHKTFNQQLEIADVIVGNKTDLYHENEQQALIDYPPISQSAIASKMHKQIYFTTHGKLPLQWLAGPSSFTKQQANCHHHTHDHHHNHNKTELPVAEQPIPECGFISAINEGEGYQSIGWRFSKDQLFNRNKLKAFLSSIKATRVKGVFSTDQGFFGYNISDDGLNENQLNRCEHSALEIICQKIDNNWQQTLINAYLAN